jgi:hypothetical protein
LAKLRLENLFKDDFTKGYTCALANIVRGHGLDVEVREALACNTHTLKGLRDAGVDDTDIEVASALINLVIYRHGCIRHLVSDGGREFDNKLWRNIAQLLQIRHSIICPYNPRANGLAENHMRTMKDALGIYCEEQQEDWDEHLAGVTMSYNITVNSNRIFNNSKHLVCINYTKSKCSKFTIHAGCSSYLGSKTGNSSIGIRNRNISI